MKQAYSPQLREEPIQPPQHLSSQRPQFHLQLSPRLLQVVYPPWTCFAQIQDTVYIYSTERVLINLSHCLGPTGSATPTPPIIVTTTELIPPTTTTEHLETTPTVTRMYFAQEFVMFLTF